MEGEIRIPELTVKKIITGDDAYLIFVETRCGEKLWFASLESEPVAKDGFIVFKPKKKEN